MPLLPRLAPWYRLVEDGDRLLLEHGRSVVVLEGGAVRALLPRLLPLLDGSRTLEQIVATARRAARPAVGQALELLAAHGLLVDGPQASGPWPARRRSRRRTASRRRSPPIGSVPRRSASSGRAPRRSRSRGCSARPAWARSAGSPGTRTTSTSPWSRRRPTRSPGCRGWNRLALERGLRWLALRPFDGPCSRSGRSSFPVSPAATSVFCSGSPRTSSTAPIWRRRERADGRIRQPPASRRVAAGIAAHLALCWLGGSDTRLPGVLHVLETRPELALGTHAVLRVPRCPACSDVGRCSPPLLPWHEAEAA